MEQQIDMWQRPAAVAGAGPIDFEVDAPQVRLLVLQPTPFCNIDCSYCYLAERQLTARMSLDDAGARLPARVREPAPRPAARGGVARRRTPGRPARLVRGRRPRSWPSCRPARRAAHASLPDQRAAAERGLGAVSLPDLTQASGSASTVRRTCTMRTGAHARGQGTHDDGDACGPAAAAIMVSLSM